MAWFYNSLRWVVSFSRVKIQWWRKKPCSMSSWGHLFEAGSSIELWLVLQLQRKWPCSLWSKLLQLAMKSCHLVVWRITASGSQVCPRSCGLAWVMESWECFELPRPEIVSENRQLLKSLEKYYLYPSNKKINKAQSTASRVNTWSLLRYYRKLSIPWTRHGNLPD